MIRPTLYPAEIHFALLVFGQRGHMQAQATVDYRATVVGEVRTLRVVLSPTTAQRQRRHLWGGTMVLADSVSEQKVVNFLSWFRGKWHEDRYAFEVRDELAFLVDGLPRARGAGIAVDVDPAFKDIMSDQPLRVAMELVAKASGFTLWASPMAGEDFVDVGSILEARKLKRTWVMAEGKVVKIEDGMDLGVLAEAAQKVATFSWEDRAGLASSLRLMRDATIAEPMRPVLRRILSAEPEEKLSPNINAVMRPYQSHGLAWLKRAIASGSGGVLADQPGLGKTLQTIAAFMAMKDDDPAYRCIVFAPKSLMGNWQNEFTKFSPSVTVLVWQGAQRKKYEDLLPQVDVVITSYETFKIDRDLLSRYPYHLAVFDEAQVLKNPDTLSHKTAVAFLAPVRVALTGTPVENRIEDLHSIMAIACPGLLPPYKEFKAKVADPFLNGDNRAVAMMRDHVSPLILRRTKDEVLSDLPPKTIIDQLCPMTDAQEAFYAEAQEQAKRDKEASEEDKSKKGALFLKLLTRLRQIAVDPRLAEPGRYRAEDSGKILTLRALMDQFDQDDANKVLIFSQWEQCLNLVKMELDERKQRYSFLTGQTTDREGQIDLFQKKHYVRYFLLGLKSGGVGLNITAANTVVFMDPWWNPAAENQAMDRAHRIGQSRNVTVYRLISEGTVEQKIANMKEIKQALADGLIDEKDLPDTGSMAGKLLD